MFLRQSTDDQVVQVGPFMDATDAVTPVTGLGNVAVELSKNGGAWAARNDATANSHASEGYYSVTLDATDTDTLRVLKIKSQHSSHLPVENTFFVLPAAVFDALIGSDYLQVDVVEVAGNSTADVYQAEVNYTVDATNTRDEYTVVWRKNNEPLETGVTDATLCVQKREDGSNLIGSTSLLQVSGTAMFKHNAEGSARLTAGEAAWAKVTATIDGAVRPDGYLVSRDSSAS